MCYDDVWDKIFRKKKKNAHNKTEQTRTLVRRQSNLFVPSFLPSDKKRKQLPDLRACPTGGGGGGVRGGLRPRVVVRMMRGAKQRARRKVGIGVIPYHTIHHVTQVKQ